MDSKTSVPDGLGKTRTAGLVALSSCLILLGCFSLYSATGGVVESLAFVRGRDGRWPRLPHALIVPLSITPALQQFGFYAPQVCSEFRLQVRLANSKTHDIREVSVKLDSEAEHLLASLNTGAQTEEPARAIATSYFTHAAIRFPEYDYGQVTVQAEYIPKLSRATEEQRRWMTVRVFYFVR